MAYQCKDCSYTCKGTFPEGRCPACGSYRIGIKGLGAKEEKARKNSIWLAVTVSLWLILAWLIYQKL